MTEEGFLALKSEILQKLSTDLDPRLTYHNRQHTEDVLRNVERIAASERILDTRLLLLIRISALFHDTGFIEVYKGHEAASCEILKNAIDPKVFTENEVELMLSLIMATKMPQSPDSVAGQILCDADLDYLGRSDFAEINNRLKKEWMAYRLITENDDWAAIQVQFLEKHRYFTRTSMTDRDPGKQKQLASLKLKSPTP